MPGIAGHISKLEEMHEVAEGKLVKFARPTVLLSCIDELKIPVLDDAKTDPSEKHQENSTTLTVNTQPYPPHSPPQDT